jgi:hypothetical protein
VSHLGQPEDIGNLHQHVTFYLNATWAEETPENGKGIALPDAFSAQNRKPVVRESDRPTPGV